MRKGLLGLAAAAAWAGAVAAFSPAANATVIINTENHGDVQDPVEADAFGSGFPAMGGTGGPGIYENFEIFHVTGPIATFDLSVVEGNTGSTAAASYYNPNLSYIALFSCAEANCGSTGAHSAPTGTQMQVYDASNALVWDVPIGAKVVTSARGAFSQAATFSLFDVPVGWYFVEIYGVVPSPDHTNFLPVLGATIAGSAPEPSTWAMLGMGFAGIGFVGFRKRRRPRYAI